MVNVTIYSDIFSASSIRAYISQYSSAQEVHPLKYLSIVPFIPVWFAWATCSSPPSAALTVFSAWRALDTYALPSPAL